MNDTCLWSQDDWDSDCWNTECGEAFCITEGTPKENKMNFCVYCGKPLKERPFIEEVEDDDFDPRILEECVIP
jgi:hypothetical protein